jgi:protein-S-isoprenylcysteine O-methyltransferase Ste14
MGDHICATRIILVLATTTYAVVHSLLASLGIKAWAKQRFGSLVDRWYRLGYNLFAVISGLPILALLYLLPDQLLYQIPFPWLVLTILGQLAGILVIVVGILQTDPWHFVGLRQLAEPGKIVPLEMVTNGLYRWVRHPLYTGGLLLIWLTPVMTLNLLTIFVILTIYLIVGARLEEKRLIHEFGDPYRAYQQRVPMLFPHLRCTK